MEPALAVALLSVLFVATHIGLATSAVRGRLVARLGEGGFFGLYSLVATLSFWALVSYYAAHRYEGAAGLAAGAVPLMRWLLMAAIAFGVALIVAGLAVYPRLPVALFGQPIEAPRGIERVTRHPFFTGAALVGGAHALLATHAAGAVLMGGLALLAVVGSRHQDAKYLRRRGLPYADYLAVTSTIPFAAILGGRQRLVWRELPFVELALGLGAAVGLRLVHDGLFAGGGRWIVLAVVGGGAVASLQSWLRSRRVVTRSRPSQVRP
jgi:uncharacterized membrane protein